MVYFRERDADVDAIEEQLGQIIFQEGQIVNEHQANGESEAFYFRWIQYSLELMLTSNNL